MTNSSGGGINGPRALGRAFHPRRGSPGGLGLGFCKLVFEGDGAGCGLRLGFGRGLDQTRNHRLQTTNSTAEKKTKGVGGVTVLKTPPSRNVYA